VDRDRLASPGVAIDSPTACCLRCGRPRRVRGERVRQAQPDRDTALPGASSVVTAEAAAGDDPLLFAESHRRAAIAYVVGVSVVAVVAGFFIAGRDPFLLAWVGVAVPSVLPALVLTALTVQRSSSPYRESWLLWNIGLVIASIVGALIVASVLTESSWVRMSGAVLSIAAIPLCGGAIAVLLRSKSGIRTLAVDLIDVMIAVVIVGAPVLLLLLEPLSRSDVAWFAVPSAVVACALPASVLAAAGLFARLPRGHRQAEGFFVVLGAVSTLNAWLLVAQSLAEFTLPASVLLAVQAADMGLLLLLPMFSHRIEPEGLDRFPAHAQVRRRSPTPALVVIVVPVLVLETVLWRDRDVWVVPVSVATLGVLLVLATVRHALMVRETARLYLELERVAEERRLLLSRLMRAVEDDRHRVAAQLHEQAVGSLSVLGSVVQTSYQALAPDVAESVNTALAGIRADLAARAESMRQLMLAVQAPQLDDESLTTALVVYSRELFGDAGSPKVVVEIDPALVLDWTTKTIVYRIAQEAIHNVARHASASRVSVALTWRDETLLLEVADDGCGFDPAAVVFESGLATMRLFAGLGDGSLLVTSSPDGGTVVRAVLGEIDVDGDAPDRNGPPPSRGRLHLVVGDEPRSSRSR